MPTAWLPCPGNVNANVMRLVRYSRLAFGVAAALPVTARGVRDTFRSGLSRGAFGGSDAPFWPASLLQIGGRAKEEP